MITVLIVGPSRASLRRQFEQGEVRIGRREDNDVVLSTGNVSKVHARVVAVDDRLVLEDLQSTNGTYLNGLRLSSRRELSAADEVGIGDYSLRFARQEGNPEIAAGSEAGPPRGSQERERQAKLQKLLHQRLVEALDLRRLKIELLADAELRARTERTVRELMDGLDREGQLPPEIDRRQLLTDVVNEALGLGSLETLLADDSVTEIMVNHAAQIYVERQGKLVLSDNCFSSDQAVLGVIERIVAPIGRRIDESSPLVDARLKDGSRVNAIIPPLALKGPCITIRKFKRDALRIEDLVRHQTMTLQMAEFLDVCVKSRKNILISGGTGSGKTTTLNVLSSFIPSDERIVTIEDAAELQLSQAHWVQLESRPANLEGRGAITIRDLVKNALRMRPDRIVVGECRSGEALDVLQAMNTGHDGSLTTLHANTPRDALARLETLVLMAGMDLPVRAIREQIASAVQIIVQQTRLPDGSRKICFITEIAGMEVDIITLQDIFTFKQDGIGEEGKVLGRFIPSGFVPRFYDDLQRKGIRLKMDIFSAE